MSFFTLRPKGSAVFKFFWAEMAAAPVDEALAVKTVQADAL